MGAYIAGGPFGPVDWVRRLQRSPSARPRGPAAAAAPEGRTARRDPLSSGGADLLRIRWIHGYPQKRQGKPHQIKPKSNRKIEIEVHFQAHLAPFFTGLTP